MVLILFFSSHSNVDETPSDGSVDPDLAKIRPDDIHFLEMNVSQVAMWNNQYELWQKNIVPT